jgi:hypothetical protein
MLNEKILKKFLDEEGASLAAKILEWARRESGELGSFPGGRKLTLAAERGPGGTGELRPAPKRKPPKRDRWAPREPEGYIRLSARVGKTGIVHRTARMKSWTPLDLQVAVRRVMEKALRKPKEESD